MEEVWRKNDRPLQWTGCCFGGDGWLSVGTLMSIDLCTNLSPTHGLLGSSSIIFFSAHSPAHVPGRDPLLFSGQTHCPDKFIQLYGFKYHLYAEESQVHAIAQEFPSTPAFLSICLLTSIIGCPILISNTGCSDPNYPPLHAI